MDTHSDRCSNLQAADPSTHALTSTDRAAVAPAPTGHTLSGVGRPPRGPGSGEDAHTAGTDQQPYDNQHNAPEKLPPEQGEDAGNDENDGNDP